MWQFEVYQDMRNIKDSMQLDSGTDICKLTTDAGVVEICVQGFVCVDWSPSGFKDDDIESPLYICDVLKALSPYIYQIDKNYRQEFKDHMYYESLNNLINRFNFSISSDASGIENIMYKTNDEIGMYR